MLAFLRNNKDYNGFEAETEFSPISGDDGSTTNPFWRTPDIRCRLHPLQSQSCLRIKHHGMINELAIHIFELGGKEPILLQPPQKNAVAGPQVQIE